MKNKIKNEAVKKIADWAESDLIRQFSTDYTYNKYKAGEITHEMAYKKAYDKMVKTMYKERKKKLEKLTKIEQSQDIKQIRIPVEWKKKLEKLTKIEQSQDIKQIRISVEWKNSRAW